MQGFIPYKNRTVEVGQRVQVSYGDYGIIRIKDPRAKLTLGTCTAITLADAEFSSSKKPNIKGYVVNYELNAPFFRVLYAPIQGHAFKYQITRKLVTNVRYVYLNSNYEIIVE